MCTSYFVHILKIFFVELGHFFHPKWLGCLVCVICNSSSFHSFIFILCIMIVPTLNICAPLIIYLGNLNLDIIMYSHVFSSYVHVGLDPASTVYPPKYIGNISQTPKNICNFGLPPKISPSCTLTLRKNPEMYRNDP